MPIAVDAKYHSNQQAGRNEETGEEDASELHVILESDFLHIAVFLRVAIALGVAFDQHAANITT